MGKPYKDSKIKTDSLKSSGNIPNHIAIIMDGNGRWAKRRGLPRVAGHQKGVETVRQIVEACVEVGVKYLTLYTFSTENWKRPKDEVSTLMRLIVKSLHKETKELHSNNIRLTTIGDFESLPTIVQKELNDAIKMTSKNTKMVLNLALSYSGRWELVEAFKRVAHLTYVDELKIDDINEKIISQNLTTAEMPDPDLVIRSGGEFRISNFLLWQIAYSEVYITDVLWPEFNRNHLFDAIKDFKKRERRFGLVSEQISMKN
ncbi:MAG: isoprenyl transferase [Ignavibacteriales bacterium]|nr:isoprenyl transferase [Ignavibacteriales bacterium]